MNICSSFELMSDRFNIGQLDISTRSFAGVYVESEGKIYYAKEHSAAIRQCKSANPQLENGMSFLHFIKSGGKLIAIVDCLALFGLVPIAEVAKAISEQLKDVVEIYEYRHPNKIRQITIRK